MVQPELNLKASDSNAEAKSDFMVIDNQFVTKTGEDITIHSIGPHMHQIGKDMYVWAELPNGKKEELIFVDHWDFNWQGNYLFKQPVKIPMGSTFHMVAHFDNSATNPRNANRPPKDIHWGEATYDEMCIAFMEITRDAEHLSIMPNPFAETVSLERRGSRSAQK